MIESRGSRSGRGAGFGEDAEAIETGHMKVQNDEVGLKLAGGLQSFDAVVRFGYRVAARTLEYGADQFAAGFLIVRNQDFFLSGVCVRHASLSRPL